MRTLPVRRHLPHPEIPRGTCHVTWRLVSGVRGLAPAERDCVLEVMRKGNEFGCVFTAAVVMDDHVHALITPGPQAASARLVQAWKSASSHHLTKFFGRRAPVWQRDYYQRWISSPALILICADYIRQNPRRKWPGIEKYAGCCRRAPPSRPVTCRRSRWSSGRHGGRPLLRYGRSRPRSPRAGHPGCGHPSPPTRRKWSTGARSPATGYRSPYRSG